jgi:hypothetical protein
MVRFDHKWYLELFEFAHFGARLGTAYLRNGTSHGTSNAELRTSWG